MLDQKEYDIILTLLIQNGLSIDNKAMIISVARVKRILERFISQIPENTGEGT